jgi:hypothetical protein
MNLAVSHDRREETPEAKALWFQSLSLEDRMDLVCELTNMILEANPAVLERKKNARPSSGRVQVLSKA